MAMLCTSVLYFGTFLSRPSANRQREMSKYMSSMYFGKTKPGRLIFRIFFFFSVELTAVVTYLT